MFPTIFSIGSMHVYSYGFFIAIGYLAGLLLGRHLARSHHLDTGYYSDLGLMAIVTGVIGARALFVLTNLPYFTSNPWEIFDFWSGGLVFYGGLIFGFFCCLLFLRWRKMPLLLSLDIMAPSVALAHAFGRIGCLGAGCCHGSYCPYPWAIRLNSTFVDPKLRDQPLHPTQIYEATALFLLAGLLVWLFQRRKLPPGSIGLIYVALYACIRAVVEMFRGDHIRGFLFNGLISTSQAIAIALLLLCGLIAIRSFRRKNL